METLTFFKHTRGNGLAAQLEKPNDKQEISEITVIRPAVFASRIFRSSLAFVHHTSFEYDCTDVHFLIDI